MIGAFRLIAAVGGLAACLLGGTILQTTRRPQPTPTPPGAVAAALPTPTPIDPAAVKAHAWKRAELLLADAERQASAALSKHLASLHAFLDERSQHGARAFAERLLSLRGKWELVRGEIGNAGGYSAFLQAAFAENLFKAEELEQAVNAAVKGFVLELDSIEQDLLVRLRRDLADDELPVLTVLPQLRSDELLQRHYHELSARVTQDLRTDLAYVVGREALSWTVLPQLVNALTQKALTAVALRAGFSAATLSASTTFSAVTFGASMVACIILDYALDQIIKAAGYDAEAKVAARITELLDELGHIITDGDPKARATLDKLKAMQRDDPDEEIRAACAEAIKSIEAGTQLYGLRHELTKLSAARASLRKETLRRLIHQESEVNP